MITAVGSARTIQIGRGWANAPVAAVALARPARSISWRRINEPARRLRRPYCSGSNVAIFRPSCHSSTAWPSTNWLLHRWRRGFVTRFVMWPSSPVNHSFCAPSPSSLRCCKHPCAATRIEDRPVPAFASRRRANSAVRVDTFTVKSVDGTAKTSRSRSTAPMMRLWHQPTLLQWPTPLSKALGTHIVHTPPSN